jgi:hypothetical protein
MRLKISIAAMILTGHWLIDGICKWKDIAWVKEQDGRFIEPDTTLMRIGAICFLLLLFFFSMVWAHIEHKRMIFKEQLDNFLNEK